MSDTVCAICHTRPVKGRERCEACLRYFRRNGYDRTASKVRAQHLRDGAVDGADKLPEGLPDDEVAAIRAAKAREAFVRWLMADTDHELRTLEDYRPAWMARAACRGQPTELFFPGRGQSTAPAKAICGRCPVAGECLDYAVVSRWYGLPLTGIWGGSSDRERRRARWPGDSSGIGARSAAPV